MSESTAQIIAFPRSGRLPELEMATATGPSPTANPLDAALARLSAAIEEQQRAVALWRDRIDELRGATHILEANIVGFSTRLHSVQSGLAGLQRHAQLLQHWATNHSATL